MHVISPCKSLFNQHPLYQISDSFRPECNTITAQSAQQNCFTLPLCIPATINPHLLRIRSICNHAPVVCSILPFSLNRTVLIISIRCKFHWHRTGNSLRQCRRKRNPLIKPAYLLFRYRLYPVSCICLRKGLCCHKRPPILTPENFTYLHLRRFFLLCKVFPADMTYKIPPSVYIM